MKYLPYEDSTTERFNGDHPGSLEIVSFFSFDFLTSSSSEINHIELCNLH